MMNGSQKLRTIIGWGSLAVIGLPLWAERPRSSLGNLEVFSGEFPQLIDFRGPPIRGRVNERELLDALRFYGGKTDKYLSEELDIDPTYKKPYLQWKKENPSKLLLLHLNGEARAIRDPEVQRRYFPGHWVYYPGTSLVAPVGTGDTLIKLKDASIFVNRNFGSPDEDGESRKPDAILVKLDQQGNRLWRESEYVSVKAIDRQSGAITVARGVYGSKSRAYAVENTYLAPLVSGWWGGQMWFYNLSSVCPRDENGSTAADHFLHEIKQWFDRDGPLAELNGIGFDVNYFKTKWPNFDVDNDGVADDGIARDGRNLWREGDWDFLRRLRHQMGDDFILTADGWKEPMQMAVGVMSGIESEGLIAYNDGWRLFGRLLNIHTYWHEQNTAKYAFSYITGKLRNPLDLKDPVHLRRLGAAIACCLGVAHTGGGDYLRKDRLSLLPELTQGRFWLGKPSGPMVVTALKNPDLLQGRGRAMADEWVAGMKLENATVRKGNAGELLVKGTAASEDQSMQVQLPPVQIGSGDVLLSFEVHARQGLRGFKPSDRVPRQINIHAEGLPVYSKDNRENILFNDTMALMGTGGFTRQYAYFRRAGVGTGTLKISLTIEGQGEWAIRNLTLTQGPLTVAREFERGVVLVNASEDEVAYDLQAPFPHLHDGALRRIQLDPAMFTDPAHPLVRSMMQVNDGTGVTVGSVRLRPLDGLFLIKR